MEFHILGPLEVVQDGRPVPLGPPQQRAVLGVLALGPGQVVSVSSLVDAVWADPPKTAVNLVQGYVSGLRRALAAVDGRDVIRTEAPGYRLDVSVLATDAGRMEALLDEAHHRSPELASELLSDALGLWRGPVLADLDVDRFAPEHVVRLEALRRSVREDRVDAYLAAGRHTEVLGELEALVMEDPTGERSWEQLMIALYRSGRQADALRTFAQARTFLVDELGLEPGPALRATEQAILEHDDAIAAPRSLASRDNLPLTLTSFVGRDDDRVRTRELLSASRLVTLAGPGGCGKTRLAVEVAKGMVESSRDGVWFVDLAPILDASDVVPAVASAMGSRGTDLPRTVAAMVDFLRDRDVLLVLDNCEHLLSECAELALAVLAKCPAVRILATSRESLGMPGEHVQRVAPLPVPSGDGGGVELGRCAAVQLFVDRAEAAGGELLIEGDDVAASIWQLCSRLDGLPLAIELAAARAGGMPVSEILSALDHQPEVIDRSVGAARHRSLNAALQWSYDLLPEPERRGLARLSVFVGGFTIAAADAVMDDAERRSAAQLVGRLVDKSLVVREHSGEIRYRLLETVRQFAREQLGNSADAASRRHAAYFMQLGEDAGMQIMGRFASDASPLWHDRLAADHENLMAALRWSIAVDEPEIGARIARGAWWSWFVRGRIAEGREWIDWALATEALPERSQLDLLYASACYAQTIGDYDRVAVLDGLLLEGCQALGDDDRAAKAYASLGSTAWATGNYDVARDQLEQSVQLARRAADAWHEATGLAQLGRVMVDLGDYDAADAALTEAEAVARAMGEPMSIALALDIRGLLAEVRGAHDDAARALTDSLDQYRRVGYEEGSASALAKLCRIAEQRCMWPKALERCVEALDLCDRVGNKGGVASALETFASLSLSVGHERRGTFMLAGAARLRDQIGAPVPASERNHHEHVLRSLKQVLGTATFEQAWQEGISATTDALLDEARALAKQRGSKDEDGQLAAIPG